MYVLCPENKVEFLGGSVTGNCEPLRRDVEAEFRLSEKIASALKC